MKLTSGWKSWFRHVNFVTHRDLGYACSALLIVYSVSGLALNHVNDWNPDFVVEREVFKLPGTMKREAVDGTVVAEMDGRVGERSHKVYDFPTPTQLKIYYEHATFHVDLSAGTGVYERVARRPLIFHSNVLHRNSVAGWKWVSDALAVVLLIVTVTGLLIPAGRMGLAGRGKWFLIGGFVPPAVALGVFEAMVR